MTVEKRTWYIYRVNSLSVRGWFSFGLTRTKREDQNPEPEFVGAFARACNLMAEISPEEYWYGYNEYWLLECPGSLPFVCIRKGTNPYNTGYVISSIPLPHLKADQEWTRESV